MNTKNRSGWVFFIFGIPAVVSGWARWSSGSMSTLNYVSLASGVLLLVLGVGSWWARRKAESQP